MIGAQSCISTDGLDQFGNHADFSPGVYRCGFEIVPGFIKAVGPMVAAQVMPQVFGGVEFGGGRVVGGPVAAVGW